MNFRNLTLVLSSIAAIAVSVAYVMASMAKESAAKFSLDEALSQEAKAVQERKAAEATAAAERERKAAAEANKIAAEKDHQAKKLAAAAAEDERKAAIENRKAKELALEESRQLAEAAKSEREKSLIELKKVEALKAKAQADESAAAKRLAEADSKLQQEKLRSEKTIADAKLKELRKIDFERIELELREWQTDLEARKNALKPEKTIADLVWAGGKEDKFIDAEGNLVTRERKSYSPENDPALPMPTRELAKLERILSEQRSSDAQLVRSNLVLQLRRLRDQAIDEGRVIDAQFYLKSGEGL